MKVPVSTYRLQFNRGFTFTDARNIIPYLSRLGISDIYASPVFMAVTGSMHGYDVVDHNILNPELGTTEEFGALQALRKLAGMGWVQDIVPNHMAFHSSNMILHDLLEKGMASEYNDFFDIEWEHTHESLRGRLLVPFLGRFYSESLEKGEITIVYSESGLSVKYYDNEFPLSLISYPVVFGEDDPESGSPDDPVMMKLHGTLHQLNILAQTQGNFGIYDRTSHVLKMLWDLYSTGHSCRDHMDRRLFMFNCTNDGENADMLDSLLEQQMYRLSFWKVAAEEINYRRFFNINGLISLRTEDEHVFRHIHWLLARLIRRGYITGVRVDHVDGLYNPAQYLDRLRELAGDLYIVVEKIISRCEKVPDRWSVQGTTGYDFMNYLNAVYCQKENAREFSRIYSGFTDQTFRYDELVAEKKRLIIEKHMTGDVDNLAAILKQISGNDRYGRDITMYGLRNALVEVIAFFPVYRTYIDSAEISPEDSGYIKTAFEKARKYSPEYSFEYDFLEKCLTLRYIEKMNEEKTSRLLHFVMRFQQYTGPFMAKGFEDTVLYIVNRLISLNEVGGEPGEFGIDLRSYHEFIAHRYSTHAYSMNATSTHDSKRGEDVRSRINVFSEMPDVWESEVKSWSRINHAGRKKHEDRPVPDRNDEYFIYQTLAGTFPFPPCDYVDYVRRIKEYMIKSVREAKVHTAWIKPDTEYEENLLLFIDRILFPQENNRFLERFIPFQKKVAFYGMLNSLSQVIVKIASPGVPDFYQGSELWDLRLVDPDNRGRVDFALRAEYLEYIQEREKHDLPGLIGELWETREDGRIKLFLIRRLLDARNSMKELFTNGDYIPLETSGRHSYSVIAFMRRYGKETAIAVATRFLLPVVRENEMPAGELWQDTSVIVPEGFNSIMIDTVTGTEYTVSGEIMLRDIFNHFPGAVLTGNDINQEANR